MPNLHRIDHRSFRVTPGKRVQLKDHDPAYTAGIEDKQAAREALLEDVSGLVEMQDLLWASKEHSLIVIFQALDAAGKDSTIKHVLSGVNPQGVVVTSFRAPSEEERLHHFLWRPMRFLPARGQMAIFNRSYYEEVLVVRVHPEFLNSQWLPEELRGKNLNKVWPRRYEEINQFEAHLTSNGTRVIKFFLNVSKKEQRKRFLERLENPDKLWKFSAADVAERGHWDEYQQAYEDMLSATSTEQSPWYVVPADKKWFARALVADVIATELNDLKMEYPRKSAAERAALDEVKRQLEAEGKKGKNDDGNIKEEVKTKSS